MTDDVLRGKVAGDRTDLQTARKPLMYVHMELMIKCMHVGSIKTLHRCVEACRVDGLIGHIPLDPWRDDPITWRRRRLSPLHSRVWVS